MSTAGSLVREIRELGCPKETISASSLAVMKAETAAAPFSRPGWIFELKLDGYRLLFEKEERGVRLFTRNGSDITRRFPEIAQAAQGFPFSSLFLDGELVVLDDDGRPSFQALQGRAQRIPGSGETVAPATVFFFDVIACEGYDLRALPLSRRKEILAGILATVDPGGPFRLVEPIPERGEDVYRAAADLGLEGIVAKKGDSPYRAGYSADWRKVRVDLAGDFAVVGFAPGPGSVRALHLGVRAEDGFSYAGSVGTGFTVHGAAEIRRRLEPTRRATPPVAGVSDKGAVWVEPELVAEVRYKERTGSGSLRQPVFLRLRDDKSPAECFLRPARVDPEEAPAEKRAAAARRIKTRQAPAATHAGKVFWPEEGYTKGDLFEYYRTIYPWLAPYLDDRPLVVDRYPDGIAGKSFFQKSVAAGNLTGVETVALKDDGRVEEYFLCPSEASLLALVNLGVIPLHASASRTAAYDRPDWCILDLDPKTAPWAHVVEIALALYEMCDSIGLPSFPKTSGGSGLHILLPLGGLLTHEQSRQLAGLVALLLTERLPEIATTARSIAARRGRVYVDALQNGRGKLLAAPFSVRPRPGATVSAPLAWSEVGPGLDPRAFTLETMPRRLEERGDPLREVLSLRPDLEGALARLLESRGESR